MSLPHIICWGAERGAVLYAERVISHLCVKRSSPKGRLGKKNLQSSLNNKEHRQKRGNTRRFQFLSTYFLTDNTIFGCGLLNPCKSANMLTMRSYMATYPINMRHWGSYLRSSHLFECDQSLHVSSLSIPLKQHQADLIRCKACGLQVTMLKQQRESVRFGEEESERGRG